MPSTSPLPPVPQENPPVVPLAQPALEPQAARPGAPELAGDGAAGLAAPSRAEAAPAADTGTAEPVEKPTKTRKPAEERIKAITPEMLPENLKPFAELLAEFWITKGGKKTPRALAGQIGHLERILADGGATAVRSQFAAAREKAEMDDPFEAITYGNFIRFGRNKAQPWTPGQPIAEPSLPMAQPEPKPERLPGRNPGVDPFRILREQQARMQQQRMELEAERNASGPQEPQEDP